MATCNKGNSVELTTFKKWDLSQTFGHKTEMRNEREMVTFVWCKICARNKPAVIQHPNCKGSIKISVMAFINGTNFVTKHTLTRHQASEGHRIATSCEKSKPVSERLPLPSEPQAKSAKIQATLTSCVKKNANEAYRKLICIAYEMAMTPTMPLKHFSVLVKCCHKTGAKLIARKEDGRTGREFVYCITEAVKEKCAIILASGNFMSILSDGSQARKTKQEKELVLVRTERNGIPTYVVCSLLEMAKYGGGDADSIVKGINSVFQDEKSLLKMDEESYKFKVVSCTADGANVNLGVHNGTLVQLQRSRPWLLKIHCINHRIELAVKSAFDVPILKAVDEFYTTNYYLLRNSGKLKSAVEQAAEALNITGYVLPKIHGTRFVGHRRRGFKNFLEAWPAYLSAYENFLADPKGSTPATRAKVQGLLKKFKSHELLVTVCGYLDLLELIVPASKVFEEGGLLPHEVQSSVSRTLLELQEKLDEIGNEDEFTDSYFSRFSIVDNNTLSGEFAKAGDKRKIIPNREYVSVSFAMSEVDKERAIAKIRQIKNAVLPVLSTTMKNKFVDFENDGRIYTAMGFMDIACWDDTKDYGKDEILLLCEHFSEPLSFAGLHKEKIFFEWKAFKKFVKTSVSPGTTARALWKSVLLYRRDEFPNLCLLASLIVSISGSNSSVERTFSFVTNILSDKRLSMSHDTLENSVIVSGNDSIWSEKEREEIIDRALEIYLSKRRITTLSSTADSVNQQPPDSDDDDEIDTNEDDEDLDSEDERLVDELMDFDIDDDTSDVSVADDY